MKQTYFLFLTIFLLFVPFSCRQQSEKKVTQQDGKTLSMRYAKGFTLEKKTDYEVVTVNSPWDTASILMRYYLVKDKAIDVPDDGIKIQVPIKTIAATSSTHYEFLTLLGEAESITGICNADRIYNPSIRSRFDSGKIVDLGDNFNLNLERLYAASPDAILVSGYEQNDKYSKMIGNAGIPVLYDQEWNENTLLGRAEWIKFVAAFYDKSSLADSLFKQVEQNYLAIAALAATCKEHPKILSGSDFRGTWYLPGGQSYMANMYRDAAADYYYANDTHTGSLDFTFESVLKNFVDADYWFGTSCYTYKELINTDERYCLFLAYKKKQVYHFNKHRTGNGSSDFWESAIARPDLLLADVVKILHPELLPGHELYYMEELK